MPRGGGHQPCGMAEQRESGERTAEIPQREAALGRAQYNRRRERQRGDPSGGRGQRHQTARRRRHEVTPQRPGWDAADRGQRPQCKDQRRKQAAQRREPEGCPISPKWQRDGQQAREQRSPEQRCRGAEQDARHDPDQSKRQNLSQVGRVNETRRGAETFQCRNRLGLARDIAGDGIADPDSADQQRGDARQVQKKTEAVEQALERWGRIGAAAQAPAGLWKRGPDLLDPGGGIAAGRQSDPILVSDQRAGA